MGFTLYSLLEAGLLVVNAIAILNEQRFLKKSTSFFQLLISYIHRLFSVGWGTENVQQGAAYYQGSYAEPQSTKAQIINLVNSVRTVMRCKFFFAFFAWRGILCGCFVFSSPYYSECSDDCSANCRRLRPIDRRRINRQQGSMRSSSIGF